MRSSAAAISSSSVSPRTTCTHSQLISIAIAIANGNHPELVGKVSRDDLLAMAEEA